MRITTIITTLTSVVAWAAPNAAAQDNPAHRVDRIVAIVGDVAIPESRVEERLLIARRQEGFPTDSAAIMNVRLQVLDQIIEDELLLQVADRDTAVNVSEEQIQQAADERMRNIRDQFSTNEDYERELRASGMTSADEHRRFITDQIRVEMTRDALISYLRQSGTLRPIPPTEAEMRAMFDAQNASGGWGERPPTVSFRQIVVRPQADSAAIRAALLRADSALRRVRSGEDFAAVAREMSEDPGSAQNGGELGWQRRGTLDRDFESVAFRLRPGQISGIVPTQFGFHIIQVERADAAEIRVRHILTRPEVTDDNRAAALAKADTVVQALRRGAAFDSLVRVYHDTEEETLLDRVVVEQLPDAYRNAVDGASPGDVIGPVTLPMPTGVKYAAIVFEEAMDAGQFTFDELREQLRQRLADQNGLKRYFDELKNATYIENRLRQENGGRVVSGRDSSGGR